MEAGAWVGKDDGFLVIDRQANGSMDIINGKTGDNQITRADELALSRLTANTTDTDLQALRDSAAMNSDRSTIAFKGSDGIIRDIQVFNHKDAGWKHMRIWRDLNQNGKVDGGLYTSKNGSGELFTLDAFGITQINLGYDDGSAFNTKSDDIKVGKVKLKGLASYVQKNDNGTHKTVSGGVGDIAIDYNKLGYKKVIIDGGYEYQFETGKNLRVAQMGDGKADLNMTLGAYDIADGNILANNISAIGSSRNVQINGGANHDVLNGGDGDDIISGDGGDDTICGNAGDDLLIIDKGDMTAKIRGGSGMDTLMVGTDASIGLILKNLEAEMAIGAGNRVYARGIY